MLSIRSLFWLIGLSLMVVTISACGRGELLSNVSASASTITPNGDGTTDSLAINYNIGQPANVSVFVEDATGQRFVLRDNTPRVPSNQPYTLIFDGTVQGAEPNVRQQVLPNGTYTWTVEAKALGDNGAASRQNGTVEVRDAASTPPVIQDLNVTEQFSPNEDAQDDVAYFTYRLPVSATVTINLSDSANNQIPFITELPEGPYAQSHIWDGKRPDGSLVPAGTYTYTITTQDPIGNVAERTGRIAVEQPGRSQARVLFTHIAPVELALGNTITVTVRVKNTGDVPIRTHGPPSGYQYSTNNSFSSVEDNTYAEKGGGFWRVGLDWGGGHGYPFRWAMTARPPEQWAEPGVADYLQPGEEADITGTVTIEQREDRMQFYVGLIHEGVGYPVNNVGRTLICVGLPNVEARCPRNNS